MFAIVSFLLVVGLSLVVTRIASVALVHTGLSQESARFQARSAFTGVGFTTSESESIVSHPVRRRIVMALMLFGNVGIVTAISSLMLSVLGGGGGHDTLTRSAALLGGVGLLWILGSSRWVDRRVCRLISAALNRWSSIDARDYAGLLHLRENYSVVELAVRDEDWIAGQTLEAAHLFGEGLQVLGIECGGGTFIGAPPPEATVESGDTLVVYGRAPRIAEFDRRTGGADGDAAHVAAVAERDRIAAAERSAAGR